MAAPRTSSVSGQQGLSRPYNALFILAHLVIAIAGLWFMRIDPPLNDVPLDFQTTVQTATFDNGLPLKTRYTGVATIDAVLAFLVTAFLAGPAGWDERSRLQQIHFLFNFLAVVSVWAVESCRGASAHKSTSYTALWIIGYQTIGAAIIVPLWFLFFTINSRPAGPGTQRDAVPLPYAQALLPAIILGYCIPTLAMYIPWGSHEITQLLVAIWQPAPLFVNILLFVLSSATISLSVVSSASASPRSADVGYLSRVYGLAGILCFATHVYVVGSVLTAPPGSPVTLASVFLPDRSTWKNSLTDGLLWIFQWDALGSFGSALIWCWMTIGDARRGALGGPDSEAAPGPLRAALLILVATIVLGPGATIAAVWSWREGRLLAMENSSGQQESQGARKPKAL